MTRTGPFDSLIFDSVSPGAIVRVVIDTTALAEPAVTSPVVRSAAANASAHPGRRAVLIHKGIDGKARFP